MDIDTILLDHRLFMDGHYEGIATLFCNVVGAKTTETKKRFLLSNWYEGYLYTLLLGIKTGNRENRIGERLDKNPKWSKYYIEQYKYAITHLLVKDDILNELNLLTRGAISKNFVSLENLFDEIKKVCDQYSNGGLKYLSKKYEKDDTIFNDYRSLKTLFENAREDEF